MRKIETASNGTSPDVMHNWIQCKCDDSHCGYTFANEAQLHMHTLVV